MPLRLKMGSVGPPSEYALAPIGRIDAVPVGGGSGAYSTAFPATEDPISEGGVWTVGTNAGSGSTGPQSASGVCFAHAADGTDYLGIVAGRFTTNKHYAEITVKRVGGYSPPDTQESSPIVGFTLSSGLSKGYELDLGFPGSTLQAVRWNNGAIGDYDFSAVTTVSGSWSTALNDGDIVRAELDSSSGSPVITMKLNGVTQIVLTDVTAGKILTGSPGIDFFVRSGTGLNLQGYAMKGFAAASL